MRWWERNCLVPLNRTLSANYFRVVTIHQNTRTINRNIINRALHRKESKTTHCECSSTVILVYKLSMQLPLFSGEFCVLVQLYLYLTYSDKSISQSWCCYTWFLYPEVGWERNWYSCMSEKMKLSLSTSVIELRLVSLINFCYSVIYTLPCTLTTIGINYFSLSLLFWIFLFQKALNCSWCSDSLLLINLDNGDVQ